MAYTILSRLVILLLLILFSLDVFAQNEPKSNETASEMKKRVTSYQGLYYDSEREKYFSNERSVFTIRPFDKDRGYLERIEVSIDGQDFKTYDGQLTFTSEGAHQIRFRAVDPVLNWSPIQIFRIYVDRTAPQGQYVWKGPTFNKGGGLFVNPQSELSIVAQDNLSGVDEIYWKSGDKSDFRKFPRSKTFEQEGIHIIETYSIDNVGNREATKSLSFMK